MDKDQDKEKIIIDIFDDITSETLKYVVKATENLPDGADVDIRIASYGGELLPTISIIETLKRFHTHANIIGFACSASAILAISCEKVSMSENGSMLLHSAWSDDADINDPGIKRCNAVQMNIIKTRCPEFDSKLLNTDTWLSSEQCLELGLIDSIYIDDNSFDYVALCKKYAAKLSTIYNKESIMQDEKVNEVIEEVKEEVKDNQPLEITPEEKHDIIEVIEKLTEEVNALKSRVQALETPAEDVKEEEVQAECNDPEQERINNIYKNLVAPQARVAIGSSKASCDKVVHKVNYKAFKSFIND